LIGETLTGLAKETCKMLYHKTELLSALPFFTVAIIIQYMLTQYNATFSHLAFPFYFCSNFFLYMS